MESSKNVSCNLLEEVFKHVDGDEDSVAGLVQLTTLLTSIACLLLSLILNTYIIVNIAYKKKFKVNYLKLFLGFNDL